MRRRLQTVGFVLAAIFYGVVMVGSFALGSIVAKVKRRHAK
jgi:hypothetical protein